MKLIDLPDCCLDRILSFLSLNDLTMVADTNVHLKASAIRVFNLKFKNMRIVLNSPGQSLIILDHFGPSIRKLSIFIQSEQSFEMLNEKCSGNLIELKILLRRGEDFQLTRPFERLQKLQLITKFKYRSFNSPLSINQYFPKLRCLEIENTKFAFEFDRNLHIEHLPNLAKFSYDDKGMSCIYGRVYNNIAKMLNLNNQITSLRLSVKEFDDLGPYIDWHKFESLRHLSISSEHSWKVASIAKLKYLRALTFSTGYGSELLKFLELEPFSYGCKIYESLKHFNIIFEKKMVPYYLADIGHSLSRFIDRFGQLEDISVKLKTVYSNEEYAELVSIAEREFTAIRLKYPTRRLNLNMICLERGGFITEIGDDFAYDFDYVFDEPEIDDNDADDLNGAIDESIDCTEASDLEDSNCEPWNLITMFTSILSFFTFLLIYFYIFLLLCYGSIICADLIFDIMSNRLEIFHYFFIKMFAPIFYIYCYVERYDQVLLAVWNK